MSRRRARRPKPTTDQRSPEQRLEALVREPNTERAGRMLSRIRHDLDANPQPAEWIAGARTLSERLVISENSFYYFVDVFTECLLFNASDADPELQRISAELEAIERAHGLREGEYWQIDDAPEDWRALTAEWDRRAEAIIDEFLMANGNGDIVELRTRDAAEFERRAEQGHTDVWGGDEGDDADAGRNAPSAIK